MLFIRITKRHVIWFLLAVSLASLVWLAYQPFTRQIAFAYVVGFREHLAITLFAPVMLVFGLAFNWRVHARWPKLDWTPLGSKSSLALMLTENKRWLVWLPYTLLLAWNMPVLAFYEEVVFRYYGSNTLIGAFLIGGVSFGLVHFFGLVSIRALIYLMVAGLIFVDVYLIRGIGAAWDLHTSYNLTALIFLLMTQKVTKIHEWLSAWMSTQELSR